MKIYFAGSIRGEKADKAFYMELVNFLQGFGIVLTEHVADAKITSYGESDVTDEHIYNRDIGWLRESDVVVADISSASHGVGYELHEAQLLGKPTICLWKKQDGRRPSPMITGSGLFIVKEYENLEEAVGHVKEFLESFSE